jgi:DNA-binding NtrC family response regulator
MTDPTRSAHVLVIDDEDLIRWSLRQGLQSEGYSVTTLPTAEGALDHAATADLVLVDWRLPGKDGLSVAKSIRAAHPSCPVILMTAYGTAELEEQAAALGIARVVLKPFDLEDMVPLVRAALSPALRERDGGGR